METKLLHATPGAVALAALYILESLLLEFKERALLSENDVQGLLSDAAKTLRAASGVPDTLYAAAASDLIDIIQIRHETVTEGKKPLSTPSG